MNPFPGPSTQDPIAKHFHENIGEIGSCSLPEHSQHRFSRKPSFALDQTHTTSLCCLNDIVGVGGLETESFLPEPEVSRLPLTGSRTHMYSGTQYLEEYLEKKYLWKNFRGRDDTACRSSAIRDIPATGKNRSFFMVHMRSADLPDQINFLRIACHDASNVRDPSSCMLAILSVWNLSATRRRGSGRHKR